MEEKVESSINKLLSFYMNSSFKKEEMRLDKEISEDPRLSALAKQSKDLQRYLRDSKKRAESLKEFTSLKREYLSDPRVKRRLELLHQVKEFLKKIELTLKLDPHDPYEGYL